MVPALPFPLKRAVCAAGIAFAICVLAYPAGASSRHRAGVLVRDPQGKVHRMCVFFDTRSISGLELLRRSGFRVATQEGSLGSAVCSISGGGCGANKSCFCHYPTFWGYWTKDRGERSWRFSDIGARARVAHDGSLDSWVWGRNGGPQPRDVSFRDVCPRAASAPQEAARFDLDNYWGFALFIAIFGAAALFFWRRRRTPRTTLPP